MNFNYYMPSRLFFGKGEIEKLGTEKLPGKKALLVISAGGSMKKYGYLDKVTDLLKKNDTDYVLFDKILPNPIKSHVMEGAAVAKTQGCDFVIGLGGGSSIDSAKAIAVMATNEGDYWDYIGGGSGKGLPVPNKPLPIIAITTTAGTGTEADPWMVVTKEETGEKIGGGFDGTFPYFSIIDPDLMMSIPAHLTAYQGFDALFHSTEGYINKTANFMSDLFALASIELIGKYLPRAVRDGSDAEARAMVALANTLAGMVESTSGCTSEHSLEHALSGYHPKLPHGAGLIMISLEYNKLFADKVCPERFVAMAKALGKTDAVHPQDFVTALAELQKACGVDNLKMSDYGIKADEMQEIARHAKDTMGGLFEVDRYQLSHEEIVSILEKSYR
ncbi:alcohol dehydrogenase [Hydrogenoanaerobacterium saccharovorans]|uniref:Alcohol dehydrogenase n=1 Tax=Hydrogenoanaerobacterium saccharovorans TaxID=474960 RepID=A0A1H8ADF0_9FIRM|nr:iron-containing alcohol dehydrogenase [Hydrogenoanaerobacterium saccharovorans]RPF48045.1 alcohol dehydrogenase [Hydrogenoanaerobacterium saccharovorans]SEM67954.1 alcohol dehydrogenase [Hydrogenoanaerobacterium saccharovorans]